MAKQHIDLVLLSRPINKKKEGHGQHSVVSLASLAAQLPARRAGPSPPGLPRGGE